MIPRDRINKRFGDAMSVEIVPVNLRPAEVASFQDGLVDVFKGLAESILMRSLTDNELYGRRAINLFDLPEYVDPNACEAKI